MSAPRLGSAQVRRLERLLDMTYKPGEIAKEIGCTLDTLMRSFIPAGAPVVFDSKNKMWINGKAFAGWARGYLASKNNKPRGKMAEDEGFCFRCRAVRKMTKAGRQAVRNQVDLLSGRCEVCGGRMSRLIKAIPGQAGDRAGCPYVAARKEA